MLLGSFLSESRSFKGHINRLWFQSICNAAWKCLSVEKVDWRWQRSDADWSCSISKEWVL